MSITKLGSCKLVQNIFSTRKLTVAVCDRRPALLTQSVGYFSECSNANIEFLARTVSYNFYNFSPTRIP
jgi:hypothetical protein